MRFFAGPILALETSCDETSAAIVEGSTVRSNVVATQIEMHQKWGGVVPEAAARAHVEALLPTVEEAMARAGVAWADLRAVAATFRPGLVGALSVGVTAAKTLAFDLDVPLIGVDHLEGHLSSILAAEPEPPLPILALIASGGHTELVLIEEWGTYRLVAETRDDAAGEAFDKGARLLGLGYPGGKAIQEAALNGRPGKVRLPEGVANDPRSFSFSGLKTAMLRFVEQSGPNLVVADAAWALQDAVVRALGSKVRTAIDEHQPAALALVGGVAANVALRTRLGHEAKLGGIPFLVPSFDLCTDNAAMIGLAASWRLALGDCSDDALEPKPISPIFN